MIFSQKQSPTWIGVSSGDFWVAELWLAQAWGGVQYSSYLSGGSSIKHFFFSSTFYAHYRAYKQYVVWGRAKPQRTKQAAQQENND